MANKLSLPVNSKGRSEHMGLCNGGASVGDEGAKALAIVAT